MMTKRRPTNNLHQPDPQPPEPSSQPPEPSSSPDVDPEREEMKENEREIKKPNLTFRQQAALSIIAATPTIAQAARQAGIGESTLYRWLEDDHFRVELARIREESADLARQELQGLMLRGVSVIAEAMDDPDKAVRLRAARYAVSFAARIGEVEKLRKEIQDIEAAMPIWTAHHNLK